MIELQRLTIAHGSNLLFEDASTSFGRANLIALVGRNGTGKSTFLRALAGLDNKCCSGRILIDGRDSSMPAALRSRTVAFVHTARVRVPGMTCTDLVQLGRSPYTGWSGRLSDDDRLIVSKALADTGMADYAGRQVDSLSDGECQRVMIARAIAQTTPVILLDEPTSFLDIPNRRQIVGLLQKLAHEAGKCILFSTHELDIALAMADRIALIHDFKLHNLSPRELESSKLLDSLLGR